MSKIWLVSDTHFGHRNICKYRDMFSNLTEHDDTILNNILTTVGKRDTLYMLGDTCFDKESIWRLQEIANVVERLHLIFGNHCYSKPEVYIGIASTIGGIVSKKNFWLSHAPIHESEMRRREGNIHGHTHATSVDDPRYRCVSLEQTDFRPIEFQRVIAEVRDAIQSSTAN